MKIKDKTYLENILKDKVYIGNEEIPVFSHYVSLAKNTLVEIGAGLGASAVLMLANSSDNTSIYSIDSFIGDTIRSFTVSKEKCTKNVSQALNSLGISQSFKRWHLYDQSSHLIASSWYEPIDFLFIDGDHKYKSVKQDFEDWFKYIKKDGVLLLHDSCRVPNTPKNTFNCGWPGPTKLANELKERVDLDLIDQVYSLTVWKKK